MLYLLTILSLILTSNSIKGTVLDDSGQPLPGASVVSTDFAYGAATDLEGRFSLELRDYKDDEIELLVTFVGYLPERLTVSLPLTTPLEISLRPDPLMQDDVLITASPAGSNRSFRSSGAISLDALQQRATDNLGDALSFEPGLSVRSFGSAPSRPVIRGFDGNRVLVLENGERMGDLGETAPDHALSMDMDAAERVEIIRGPASFLYGSGAIGGVVNLFNSDIPTEWVPGVSGRFSGTGTSVNDGGSGYGRVQYASQSSAVNARIGFRSTGDIRTPAGLLPDTFNESFNGALGFGFRNPGFVGGLSISGLDQIYGLPEEIESDDERVEIRLNRINLSGFGQYSLAGSFDQAQARFNMSRYGHQEWEVESEPDGSLADEDLEIDFRTLTFSGSFMLIRSEGRGDYSGVLGASTLLRQINIGGDEGLTPDGRNINLALFGYVERPLTSSLSLQAGARVDYSHLDVFANSRFEAPEDPTRSDIALSGSAGLNFRPFRGFEAGIQLARSFRTPSIEELYTDAAHLGAGAYEIGDPDLSNEIGYGIDLFSSYSSTVFSLEFNSFFYYINNFIYYNPTGETDEASQLPVFTVLSDNARYFGFEADAVIQPLRFMQLRTGFDLVRAERTDDNTNLPFIPPARFRSQLGYDTGSWYLGGEMIYALEQDKVTANEEPTEAYTLVNLTAGLRLDAGGRHTLSTRVDNLFNESYRSPLSRVDGGIFRYPMPGRGFTVRYQYVF